MFTCLLFYLELKLDQCAHTPSPPGAQRNLPVFRGGSRFLPCRQVRVRCVRAAAVICMKLIAKMLACTCVSKKKNGSTACARAHVC